MQELVPESEIHPSVADADHAAVARRRLLLPAVRLAVTAAMNS